MKDLNNLELAKCISEEDHRLALVDCLKGSQRSFYNRWLLACDTLNILACEIIKLKPEFKHINLPNPTTETKILNDIKNGIYKTGYDNWVAAGRTVDVYNEILKTSSNKPKLPTSSSEPDPNITYSNLQINFLLWKPVSEGGGAPYQGKPVILSKGSENIGFIVNGQKGKMKGANNGYQSCDMTTVLATKLPANTILEFFDRDTNLPVLFKGKTKVIIQNPQMRYEFTKPDVYKEIDISKDK